MNRAFGPSSSPEAKIAEHISLLHIARIEELVAA
jgi:hypothetical protein